jgi:hypothetical protein
VKAEASAAMVGSMAFIRSSLPASSFHGGAVVVVDQSAGALGGAGDQHLRTISGRVAASLSTAAVSG